MSGIIQTYFAAVAVCFFQLVFTLNNRHSDKRINKLFFYAALTMLFLIVIDIADSFIGQSEQYVTLRMVLICLKYTLLPATVYVILMVSKMDKDKDVHFLWGAPLILNTIITTSVFYSDSYLYLDSEGVIQFGVLGVFPYCVAFAYTCALIITIVFQLIRYNRRVSECVNVCAIGIIPVVSTILESIYDVKGLLLTGLAVSFAFFYVFIILNQKDLDTLTKVMNRRRYYLDAHENANHITAVMVLDFNGLKQINDTYGHNEGDKALLTMISVVKDTLPYGVNLYRAGGDEFTMLCFEKTEKEVSALVDQLIIAMESVSYTWAVGYAMVTPECNIDEALMAADRRMYADKRSMKNKYASSRMNTFETI